MQLTVPRKVQGLLHSCFYSINVVFIDVALLLAALIAVHRRLLLASMANKGKPLLNSACSHK
jgi:hypothetical protein